MEEEEEGGRPAWRHVDGKGNGGKRSIGKGERELHGEGGAEANA